MGDMMTRTASLLAALAALCAPAVGLAQSTTTTASTSTTTSTLACDTAVTFPALLCREDALTSAISSSREFSRPKFQGLLLRQMNLLKKRTMTAEDRQLAGKRAAARNWLKGAVSVLKTIEHEMEGQTGRTAMAEGSRAALTPAMDGLLKDLKTLRDMI